VAEGPNGAVDWFSQKVPMWVILLAVLGTGSTTVAGGAWRWLENNEPRLSELRLELTGLHQDIARIEREHEKLAGAIALKANTADRLEMLGVINRRMDALDRHLEAIDFRLLDVERNGEGRSRVRGSIPNLQ